LGKARRILAMHHFSLIDDEGFLLGIVDASWISPLGEFLVAPIRRFNIAKSQ
jgi:hypothetical protein